MTFEHQGNQWSITHHSCWQWPEKVNKDQSPLPTLSGTLSGDVANLLRVHYSQRSLTFSQTTDTGFWIQLYISFTHEKTQPGQVIHPPTWCHISLRTLSYYHSLQQSWPRSLPLSPIPRYMYAAEVSVKSTSTAFRTFVQCPDFYRGWSQQDKEVSRMQDKIWGDILFWFFP